MDSLTRTRGSSVLAKIASQDIADEKKSVLKIVNWVALIFLAGCPIGGYMSYDAPGALSHYYITDLGLSLTQIGSLYTAYAIPCVLLSPFCGTLALQFGPHRLLLAGNIFAVLGALGFAFATEMWAMILVRIVFGTGVEMLLVAVALLVEGWFRNSKYLGVAFGILESFPLVGTLIAFALLPAVAQALNLQKALFVALGVCIACCCGSILYYYILHPSLPVEKTDQGKSGGNVFQIYFKAIKKAKKEFWLICGFCFALDSTGFPFLAMASQFFYDKYGYSESYSTALVCLFCLIAVVIGPILNFAIDKIGSRRVTISIFSSLMNFGAFLIFGLSYAHPAYGIVVAALAYVIGCGTVYNLASRTVDDEKDIGTLFSILSIFPNLTFLVMPLIFGALKDYTGKYFWSCMFFAIVDLGGFLCMLVLYRVDTCDLDTKSSDSKTTKSGNGAKDTKNGSGAKDTKNGSGTKDPLRGNSENTKSAESPRNLQIQNLYKYHNDVV
eukprot:Phypoly_transcript_06934.p1 GENE.Phypoly_transcript_06934~~Phypoly_transcript_06934.p1  ORF type:complete len:498 (+),score=39.25 Phypoly_transcript_06934:125-1618(+)